MMKQPELGRKISELRKSKGLTQEELVEKCNLSVRTLIRIENGEVMPRSYTIKAIFSALDHQFYDSTERSPINPTLLKRLSTYILNLSSIKIRAKKFSIILGLILVVSILAFAWASRSLAPNKSKTQKLIEQLNAQLVRNFNSGQLDSLGLLYADSASLLFWKFPVFKNNLPLVKGRNGIKSVYALYHMNKNQFVLRKSHKMTFDNSTVVDIGIIQLENTPEKVTGAYFCQWRYVDRKWVIENEMFNFDNSNY